MCWLQEQIRICKINRIKKTGAFPFSGYINFLSGVQRILFLNELKPLLRRVLINGIEFFSRFLKGKTFESD
jgi:hypothetical protein